MAETSYIRATSVAHACELLREDSSGTRLLAGGTDLLIEWRRSSDGTPRRIIDISFLDELNGITVRNDLVHIGPLTTHTCLVTSQVLQQAAPLLSSAAKGIGSPQIRNRGTVGGNIMNAAACADTVPPLVALGAEITLQSTAGRRHLKLADLFLKPYRTNARPDEILTDIFFPKPPAGAVSAFIKLGRRNAVSISRLSVAAIVVCDAAGIIAEARIVPGATFPVWRRVCEAEQMLRGERCSPALFRAAGEKVSELMSAETGRRWSSAYKEPVVAVLVRRALEQCCPTETATV